MRTRRAPALALSVLTCAAALVGPPTMAAPADAVASSSSVRLATPVDARALLADSDGDGLDDVNDGCPAVASDNPTGCPTVSRSARLRYLAGKNLLQARVRSSETACYSRSRVKLWRVTRGDDVRLKVESASYAGFRRFKVPRGASYYVTVSSSYAPGIAECAEGTSRTVLVPRPS